MAKYSATFKFPVFVDRLSIHCLLIANNVPWLDKWLALFITDTFPVMCTNNQKLKKSTWLHSINHSINILIKLWRIVTHLFTSFENFYFFPFFGGRGGWRIDWWSKWQTWFITYLSISIKFFLQKMLRSIYLMEAF